MKAENNGTTAGKICTICGLSKAPDAFQTYTSRGSSYTRNQCKRCVNAKIEEGRREGAKLRRRRKALTKIMDRRRVKTATELGL